MFSKAWQVLKFIGNGYIEDNCLSRGAAIAYFTVLSLAPVLIIVIAIAGFVFGEKAARGALLDEISSLMGRQGGEAIQTMIASASISEPQRLGRGHRADNRLRSSSGYEFV